MTYSKTHDNMHLLKQIYILAWPAIIEQALQTIVQYTDAAMVGRIGADASAAVGLTATMNWLVSAPLYAMGIGVLSCIAKSLGAKREEDARIAGMQGLYIAGVLGVILTAITLAISPALPRLLGADPAIRSAASVYFSILCTPLIFRAVSIILGSALRGAGDTKSPMFANLAMNGINIVLNGILIFGCKLGTTGAALASAISFTVGGVLMLSSYLRNPFLSPKGRPLQIHPAMMKHCLQIGIPVALERISACLGQVVFTSLVTSLGTISLATHSIAITAEQAFYIPGYGMQAAASTLAGNALGERRPDKFKRTTLTIGGLAFLMMTLSGALLFCFPSFMMSIFTKDIRVITGGIPILKIVAFSEPMFAVLIILEGVFNGIGDTKTPFFFSLISMWGVRILGTCFCLFYFDLGLMAVWCCMVLDNVTRCFLLLLRFWSGRWKHKF